MIVNNVTNYEKRGKTRASEARFVFFSGAIGIGFASHWLKKWREFHQPIAERSNAKEKNTQN